MTIFIVLKLFLAHYNGHFYSCQNRNEALDIKKAITHFYDYYYGHLKGEVTAWGAALPFSSHVPQEADRAVPGLERAPTAHAWIFGALLLRIRQRWSPKFGQEWRGTSIPNELLIGAHLHERLGNRSK
jgi:hypothetical protein